MKRYYTFFAVLAVISAVTIGTNILVRRGPVHDATAVSDIRSLQSAVDTYYLSKNQLPDNLSQVKTYGDTSKRLADYEYNRVDKDTYELCTTFMTKHQSDNKYAPTYPANPSGLDVPDPDEHDKGRQCFNYAVIPVQQPYPIK